MSSIKSVTIAGNLEKKSGRKVIGYIIETFKKNGFDVSTLSPIKYGSVPVLNAEAINQSKTDLLCVLGGDGTIIGIIREIAVQVPILGINVGSKGVLTEIYPDEVVLAIDAMRQNRFYIQNRMLLTVGIKDPSEGQRILNEVLFYRSSMTKLPTFSVVQKDFSFRNRMDGLIVSTPTGSTGHSFSYGGPIVDETLRVILLNLIGSTQRLPPMVLQPLPIKVTCSDKAYMVVDGQIKYAVPKGETVIVKESREAAKLMRIFSGRLAQMRKLGFDVVG
jgi:NAD+ kinase